LTRHTNAANRFAKLRQARLRGEHVGTSGRTRAALTLPRSAYLNRTENRARIGAPTTRKYRRTPTYRRSTRTYGPSRSATPTYRRYTPSPTRTYRFTPSYHSGPSYRGGGPSRGGGHGGGHHR